MKIKSVLYEFGLIKLTDFYFLSRFRRKEKNENVSIQIPIPLFNELF